MTCDQIQPELLAYLTGELDEASEAAIRRHLADCEACTAEAAELRQISQHLSAQLKQVPPDFAVPPLVAARIDRALRAEKRRSRLRPWLPGLGIAASVAAAVLVTFSAQPDLAEGVSSWPVVGAVATPFLHPDLDLHLGAMPPSTAASLAPVRSWAPNVSETAGGITLRATRVEQFTNQTRLTYRALGVDLDDTADLMHFQPVILLNGQPLKLYRLTADQRGADLLFQVTFEPIPAGATLELQVNALPVTGGQAGGPWKLTIR
jgi:hypothetical protein